MFALALRAFGFASWLDKQLEPMMVSPETRKAAPTLARDLLARNRDVHRQALFHAAMAILVRPTSIVDQLWQIRVPALVVVGRHDRTTPPQCGRLVARAIDRAELVQVDAGHLVPLEAPQEATQLITGFVRRVCGREPGSPPRGAPQPTHA
ncbi:MAG: alpha/beta hydrolase [Polyangiaceae bacterium]|nr:alpha/beta hydrolase [Polyangiaceae bacterium]